MPTRRLLKPLKKRRSRSASDRFICRSSTGPVRGYRSAVRLMMLATAAEKPLHEVQHVMRKSRHNKSCGHEQQPDQAHTYGRIGECYDAGDDRSRSEHDSDLERRGSKFEIMIHVELKIAILFHFL